MSRFRYSGPNSAVTLKVSDGQGGTRDQDVLFWHGHEVELPADHDYVKVLVAKGYLTLVPTVQAAAAQEAAPTEPKAAATEKSGKAK